MPTGSEDRTFRDLALSYAERGWPVFPLAPGKKTPRFRKGHPFGNGCHSASTHKPTIREMWRKGGQDCNIGIATGPESDLFVLDFDTDGDGAAANDMALKKALGLWEWPMGTVVRTPSGGWHRYYKSPDRADRLTIGAGELGLGVDHRGPGGYVVAPGSIVDGQVYEVVGDFEELAELPAEVVEHLTAKRAKDRQQHTEPIPGPVGSPATFAELWAEVGITLAGGDQLYSCPWHGADVHPSLHINADDGTWLCFACNRHGGHRMLWREVRPGTKLPGGEGSLSDEYRQVLDACVEMAKDISLFQTANDHKGYLAILGAARKKGSLDLGVPGRWLAEEAGFKQPTAPGVLLRLVSGGFIERIEVQGTTAAGYRVCRPLTCNDATDTQSYDTACAGGLGPGGVGIRDVEVDTLPISHDALRHGALGAAYKTATHLMHHGKDTITGIQQALGYKARTSVTRHLKKLITGNFVVRDGDLYRWVTPDTATLDAFAQNSGTAGKGDEAKRQHAHDREGYQAHQDYLAQRMATSRLVRAHDRVERALASTPTPPYLDPYAVIKGCRVDFMTGEIVDLTEQEGGTP